MKSTLVSTEIAEPYAQALMSVARDNNLIDQISDDVNSLVTLLTESGDLRNCLMSPAIKPEQKKAVLEQLAGDQLHPFTKNFLMLLVDRGRILFLDAICRQFQALVRQLRQTVLAEVTTATPLSEAQLASIHQKVVDMTQAQQVEMDVKVDPEILGGVIIKVGSQIVDVSLRGQLRRIGIRLANPT